MKHIHTTHSFEQIRLLSDARRLEILRLLMWQAATLTQLAGHIGHSPAWVRHHVLALESADLIEMVEIRTTGKVTEKFYRAKSGGIWLQEMILPKTSQPVLIFSGSHDLAIETIAQALSRHITLLGLPVGSLDGLLNLRQGLCQVSGAHLLDENGDYNQSFVRHFFPDRAVTMLTLAHRTQGLMIAAGNPLDIRAISDLTRPEVRFVNRSPGSGTRLWFDHELNRLNIPSEQINGYERMVNTHTLCAEEIVAGTADAAIGLQAAAMRHSLDFIPHFEERYDLVLPREQEEALIPLLDHIQSAGFRQALSSLGGYSTSHSGEQIALQKERKP